MWFQRLVALLFLFSACAGAAPLQQQNDTYASQRKAMVEQQLASRDIDDPRVLEAMREVPRHRFVPESVRPFAYSDSPLPIGHDQTISQPYIVALMTQLAEPGSDDRVLEVGTGSGYQAAVLSRIVDQVFTIEIIPELAARARESLREIGYENVHVRHGDGYQGWPEEAPFDLILITAAAPRIPEPLREQLKEGGRLVVPEGDPGSLQRLVVYTKEQGELKGEEGIAVRFVPMTGEVQQAPDFR